MFSRSNITLKISRKYRRTFASKSNIKVNNKLDHIELIVDSNGNMPTRMLFDAHWLRMNCHSSLSKQPNTGQRTIDLNAIPHRLLIDHVEQSSNRETLTIKWNSDSYQHDTQIPVEFLLKNGRNNEVKFEACKKIEFFDYSKIVNESQHSRLINRDESFKWLWTLAKFGLCVLKNVPTKENMVKQVAELIAPVQRTIYGDLFDVRVDRNPINIAYSNVPLELHMDLMYYESPPGLQFLHCLEFDQSIQGGESIFLDSFEAVHQFSKQHPGEFAILTQVPATFQKFHVHRDRPVLMVYRRPHIVLDVNGRLSAVNWSPPFEGPLTGVSCDQTRAYYSSYLKLAKFLNNNPAMIEYRLKPGEVACFNNRRVLHGRKGFSNTANAVRHFQGCYVNIDEFKSEVIVRELFSKNDKQSLDVYDLKTLYLFYGNQDCSI